MNEYSQWLMVTKIRHLIAEAAKYDIEINELTVSPTRYDELIAEASVTLREYDQKLGECALRMLNVKINKRACKGCCRHG